MGARRLPVATFGTVLLLAVLLALGACARPASTPTDGTSPTGTGTAAPSPTRPFTTPTPLPPYPTDTLPTDSVPSPAPGTPTPMPAAVHVASDPLPDGQLLPTGLYAILRGEGANYDVRDAWGRLDVTFQAMPTDEFAEYSLGEFVGLYSEDELFRIARPNRDRIQTLYPVPSKSYILGDQVQPADDTLLSWSGGFYQCGTANDTWHLVLYSPSGVHLKTLTRPVSQISQPVSVRIGSHGGRIVVWTYEWLPGSHTRCRLTYLLPDGTLEKEVVWNDAVDENHNGIFAELLGDRYALMHDETDEIGYDVMDVDGKVVLKDVDPPWTNGSTDMEPSIDSFGFYVFDYFAKDGVVYGSDLKPVPNGTFDAAGGMIPHLSYVVEGIPCVATTSTLAVGRKDGRMAVRTAATSFSFPSTGEDFLGFQGDSALVRRTSDRQVRCVDLATDATVWTRPVAKGFEVSLVGNTVLLQNVSQYYERLDFRILSLQTGKDLWSFGKDVTVEATDGFYLVHLYRQAMTTIPSTIGTYHDHGGIAVIDGEGRLRYESDSEYAQLAGHGCLKLFRGPYVGIADLEGNWIMKALRWDLTRD